MFSFLSRSLGFIIFLLGYNIFFQRTNNKSLIKLFIIFLLYVSYISGSFFSFSAFVSLNHFLFCLAVSYECVYVRTYVNKQHSLTGAHSYSNTLAYICYYYWAASWTTHQQSHETHFQRKSAYVHRKSITCTTTRSFPRNDLTPAVSRIKIV